MTLPRVFEAGRLRGLTRCHALHLLLLFVLGLAFVVGHTTLQLNTDDIAWLHGEESTVFDGYRHLPRLAFGLLYVLFGPSPVAALTAILATHALNAWLVYRLALRLLADRLAAILALAIFLINPLTLGTLTWISCFSYVMGTSLALLALLAVLRGLEATGRTRVAWLALAFGCYVAGLFSSHELFFLPALFAVLGWLRGSLRPAAWLAALGLAVALGVNAWVYGFGRYGLDASRLWSLDFVLAYISTALASGLALALAYPLSFVVKGHMPLQVLFTEPLRWLLTALVAAAGAWAWARGRRSRLALALAASFVALISPYVLRLYLIPDGARFHISYILSGRVFYLAFTVLALALGYALAGLLRRGRASWQPAWPAVLFVSLLVYGRALWLYRPQDVAGLSAVRGLQPGSPPRWNPFADQHPAWLILPLAAALLAFALLRARTARTEP